MNEPPVANVNSPFKDRRTGLIVFGVLVIIIGLVCAMLIPVMVLGQVMSATAHNQEINYRMIIPGAAVYGLLAVALVWLGIGSIMARRWARALLLIIAWAWLAIGICSSVIMIFLLPQILAAVPPGGQPLPPLARYIATALAVGVLSVVYVALPGLLVFFYGSRHVKATCETNDTAVRWTDACPLPVLGLSLLLAFGVVVTLPAMATYGSVMPFFGQFLSGVPGSCAFAVMMALWAYCAWATYRLRPSGWWTTMIVFVVIMISALVTFACRDLMEMYRLMGLPENQIEMMQGYGFLTGPRMGLLMFLCWLPFFAYLLWVRKYFRKPA